MESARITLVRLVEGRQILEWGCRRRMAESPLPERHGEEFKPRSMSASAYSRHLSFRCPELNEGRLVRLGLRMSGGPDPRWAAATCLEK